MIEFFESTNIINKNELTALQLLDKILETSNIEIRKRISELYRNGIYVKKDIIKADAILLGDISCVICMNDRRNMMFVDCKHIMTCENCASKLIKYPVYDSNIVNSPQKVYI
jgi:hypothetical protein